MANIGFLGGSFDPVHLGHISLAIDALENNDLDEVWLCPNSVTPLKQEKPLDAKHRLEMLNLVATHPQIKVIDLEVNGSTTSYTIDTLDQLSKKYPSNQFFLIIAHDLIDTLYQWKSYEKLLEKYPLLTGKRDANPHTFKNLNESQIETLKNSFFDNRVFEISSTEIRKRLKNNLYCDHLLNGKVLDYIRAHQLY